MKFLRTVSKKGLMILKFPRIDFGNLFYEEMIVFLADQFFFCIDQAETSIESEIFEDVNVIINACYMWFSCLSDLNFGRNTGRTF